jgi:hypothetical protein
MIHSRGVKELIKNLMLNDFDVALDEIMIELQHRDIELSRLMVSYIRSEFRETLRFLTRKGIIKPVKARPPPVKTRSEESRTRSEYERQGDWEWVRPKPRWRKPRPRYE